MENYQLSTIINEQNMKIKDTTADILLKKIDGNEIVMTLEEDIAKEFNDFFSSIGQKLAEALPNSDHSVHDYLGNYVEQSLFWKPVTKDKVLDLIR